MKFADNHSCNHRTLSFIRSSFFLYWVQVSKSLGLYATTIHVFRGTSCAECRSCFLNVFPNIDNSFSFCHWVKTIGFPLIQIKGPKKSIKIALIFNPVACKFRFTTSTSIFPRNEAEPALTPSRLERHWWNTIIVYLASEHFLWH